MRYRTWPYITVEIKFVLQDMWIGLYWKVEKPSIGEFYFNVLYLYICILPMLPIIIRIADADWKPKDSVE